MKLNERIEAFAELGRILRDSLDGKQTEYTAGLNFIIDNQQFSNPWFTPDNVRASMEAIASELTEANLVRWTSMYPALENNGSERIAGIVMAGNIPLVGFHDFISVLIAGYSLLAKTSSKDNDLIRFISDILIKINHGFLEKIKFTEGLLKGFDSVIATGSDNSSRYFEYYFAGYPHIIRKNRNSIAILDGNETIEEIKALGRDIFLYFGLGCRSVSKIFLPEDTDIKTLIGYWEEFSPIINHHKYANNYDYNKAIYMVNREHFFDSGYLLLRESKNIASPVAVLFFEFYKDRESLQKEIRMKKDKIQCIVSKDDIYFGKSQQPHLWDYADGIDTIDFLLKKI